MIIWVSMQSVVAVAFMVCKPLYPYHRWCQLQRNTYLWSANGELVVWIFGTPYEKDCYKGVPGFESQTTNVSGT